ncbi:MAG: hypothetical protein WB420_11850 [Bradyrhizobium sp.]
MNIKANGRSALILATGLFVCFAGPSQAAAGGADNATATSKSGNAAAAPLALDKNLKRHRKSYAHGKSSKVAQKPAADKKPAADQKAAAPDVAADDGGASPALPSSVANANAQLPSADTPAGNAKAMSARANDVLQADGPAGAKADNGTGDGTLLVAADQLNDVDRALHEGNPPPAPVVLASADPRAAPVLASSPESSAWDQTSLIGKIFIGFGALLTMASAARMFMA